MRKKITKKYFIPVVKRIFLNLSSPSLTRICFMAVSDNKTDHVHATDMLLMGLANSPSVLATNQHILPAVHFHLCSEY